MGETTERTIAGVD